MRSRYIRISPPTITPLNPPLTGGTTIARVWGGVCSIVLTFILVAPLPAAQYGKTILALYKSSEGYSGNSNPIKSYMEPEIKKMGLKIEYRDFESGIAGKESLSDVRAIITWYKSGVVENKKIGLDYIDFLNGAIDSGCKLVIINSFGAYGYKENGAEKWDLINKINPLFKKIGFYFKGFWTDDPSKLRIISKDSFLTEKEAKQDVNISRHYQQIIPLRKDVETYLTVKRTDNVPGLGNGISSVILTSKNGGFALENYVLSGNKLLLNAPEFLRRSLFFDDGYQDVCVIIGDVKNRDFILNNFNYAFKYAKISNTIIDAERINSMLPEDLLPFNVIFITSDTVQMIPFNVIKEYVSRGGNLIFAKSADLSFQFKELVGAKEYGASETFKEGFSFDPDFSMNRAPIKAEKLPIAVRKTSLAGCKVLASALDKDKRSNYPVLWETSYGKGKILYWNTDLLLNNDKGYRGAFVQSIHYICSGFVTGMANIGLMMIDDLPAPLWNTNYREYRIGYYSDQLKDVSDPAQREKLNSIIKNLQNYSNITDTNFITNIWIKDIEAWGKQFGFNYSAYLIFNYNKKTVLEKNEDTYPMNDFYLAENNIPVKMGFRILDNNWELGLHGYNHQSLTLTKPTNYDSLPWTDRSSMVKALNTAKKEWISIYGDTTLPFSYVAPLNIIDTAGLSALSEVFPSMLVICTLYVSEQGETEQEFEWTKDRRFFQIPRISSGYLIKSSNKFFIFDAIHNFGVVSHFIHPDDVFDENRSSGYAGWNAMKSSFINDFTQVKKCIPSIRWMTVKDAYSEFQFYNSANIKVKESGKTIYVENSNGSERYLFFRMRLKKGQKIKSVQNCQIVNANYNSGDVILKTSKYVSKIVLN